MADRGRMLKLEHPAPNYRLLVIGWIPLFFPLIFLFWGGFSTLSDSLLWQPGYASVIVITSPSLHTFVLLAHILQLQSQSINLFKEALGRWMEREAFVLVFWCAEPWSLTQVFHWSKLKRMENGLGVNWVVCPNSALLFHLFFKPNHTQTRKWLWHSLSLNSCLQISLLVNQSNIRIFLHFSKARLALLVLGVSQE